MGNIANGLGNVLYTASVIDAANKKKAKEDQDRALDIQKQNLEMDDLRSRQADRKLENQWKTEDRAREAKDRADLETQKHVSTFLQPYAPNVTMGDDGRRTIESAAPAAPIEMATAAAGFGPMFGAKSTLPVAAMSGLDQSLKAPGKGGGSMLDTLITGVKTPEEIRKEIDDKERFEEKKKEVDAGYAPRYDPNVTVGSRGRGGSGGGGKGSGSGSSSGAIGKIKDLPPALQAQYWQEKNSLAVARKKLAETGDAPTIQAFDRANKNFDSDFLAKVNSSRFAPPAPPKKVASTQEQEAARQRLAAKTAAILGGAPAASQAEPAATAPLPGPVILPPPPSSAPSQGFAPPAQSVGLPAQQDLDRFLQEKGIPPNGPEASALAEFIGTRYRLPDENELNQIRASIFTAPPANANLGQ